MKNNTLFILVVLIFIAECGHWFVLLNPITPTDCISSEDAIAEPQPLFVVSEDDKMALRQVRELNMRMLKLEGEAQSYRENLINAKVDIELLKKGK